MKYAYFGNFIAKEEKRDELADLWEKAASELEKNPDCLEYVVSISGKDNNTVWLW